MRIALIKLLFILLTFASLSLSAQDITTSVTGKVSDEATNTPLSKASVRVSGSSSDQTVQTDESGRFSLQVPVGRYRLSVSYTGYRTFIQELLAIAGKESVLSVTLVATAQQLQEVEVSSASSLPEVPGLQSLSIEKTLRTPANFLDPVRGATTYPGVIAANDQSNAIIVRGNSPNGLLWRLNGVDIVNPNHLANAGTLSDIPAANGGGVNILSAQMLDRTDFYMGSFPANYGNALSGIIDMRLREGNKNDFEYTAQASLIGMDVAAEGPIGQKKKSSFLANYRYSTVGLLSAMGVDLGDEAIAFQDISFNVDNDLKNGGKLSLFGLWGNSRNNFETKDSVEWEEDKDKYGIEYQSDTYAVGANYIAPVLNGKLFIGVAYSGSAQDRIQDISGEFPRDDFAVLSDHYNNDNSLVSGNIRYEVKPSESLSWEMGLMTNYQNNSLQRERVVGCLDCINEAGILNGSVEGILLQPFVNFKAFLSPRFMLNTGVRYLHFTYNEGSSSLEPRALISFKPDAVSAFDLSYSLTSQMQSTSVYIADGNKDLGLTRSHHIDLAYTRSLSGDFNLRSGVFYQHLFDVPIEDNAASTFSALNILEGNMPGDLVNKGTGENYGVDVTLEKFFYGKNYFLLGGSYYDSKYTGGDGVKRNTRFNGNYTFSGVYGKEWVKASRNRTIGLNIRTLYLGGLRSEPVNTSLSRTEGETIYDPGDGFNQKLSDYFRVDLRLSFRKNKPRYTRTFAIDIQNLTSQENDAYQYYDFTQQKVVTKFQLGIIPVLVYRIDF